MIDILRMVFFGAAIICGLIFILAVKNGSQNRFRWLLIACILAVLGVGMILLNNYRISSNKKALESSPVISKAMEDITPILTADNRLALIRSQADGQFIKEPYVLVPIDKVYNWDDRTKDSYQITDGDSCGSGGQFISAEQLDQCQTIFFYETFVLEMPYRSTNGTTTTGKSESKTVYVYDVKTHTLFDYKVFDTNLPSISSGTPNMKVDTQTILDWIKEQIHH